LLHSLVVVGGPQALDAMIMKELAAVGGRLCELVTADAAGYRPKVSFDPDFKEFLKDLIQVYYAQQAGSASTALVSEYGKHQSSKTWAIRAHDNLGALKRH
jgi:hypothetical protein